MSPTDQPPHVETSAEKLARIKARAEERIKLRKRDHLEGLSQMGSKALAKKLDTCTCTCGCHDKKSPSKGAISKNVQHKYNVRFLFFWFKHILFRYRVHRKELGAATLPSSFFSLTGCNIMKLYCTTTFPNKSHKQKSLSLL